MPALAQGDVVACKTSPAFVDHLWEMLGPLLAGASLLLLEGPLLPQQPAAFVDALASGGATHLVAVPGALQLLLPQLGAARQRLALRLVVSSGEPLTWQLARQLQGALPLGCTLLNIYGSTEVAADCTAFEVPPLHEEGGPGAADLGPGSGQARRGPAGAEGAGRAARQVYVPAGTPLEGFQVAIIASAAEQGSSGSSGGGSTPQPEDPGLGPDAAAGAPGCSSSSGTTTRSTTGSRSSTPRPQVLPAGQVGEIWVAGAGLAAGYLHSPELTGSRFVQLQLDQSSAQHLLLPPGAAPQLHERYFRTGDRGFVDPADGLLHVLGRRDHQVRLLAPRGRWWTALPLHTAGGPCGDRPGLPAPAALRGVRLLANPAGIECGQAAGAEEAAGLSLLQVKVAGARVDLLEVETQLQRHPAVAQAAVAACSRGAGAGPGGQEQRPGGGLQLAAFVVLQQAGSGGAGQQRGQEPTDGTAAGTRRLEGRLAQELVQWLAERLPPAAVPGLWVQLAALPRSPAGKVLRAELPGLLPAALQEVAAAGEATAATAAQRPQQAATHAMGASFSSRNQPAGTSALVPGPLSEARVMLAFRAALQLPKLEPTDNFFSWGGSSLAAAEVAGQLDIQDLAIIYAHPTARSLAAALRSQQQLLQEQGETAGGAGQAGAELGAERPSKRQRQEEGAAAAPAAPAEPRRVLSAEQLAAAPQVAPVAAHHARNYMQQLLRSDGSVQLVAAGQSQLVQLQGGSAAPLPGPGSPQHQDALPLPAVLEPAWRCKLGRCVDAPLLALLFDIPSSIPAGAGSAAPARAAAEGGGASSSAAPCPSLASVGKHLLVCACSHDGDVALVQAASGQLLWTSQLPARADAGLAACLAGQHAAHVVAACGDGRLYCLGLSDGAIQGTLDCGGDIKAPPVLDPWCGHIWATSHGRRLVCMRPPGQLLHSQELPGPSSVAPAFLELAQGQRLVLAACLDGSLTAFRIGGSGGSGSGPAAVPALEALWVHRCSSPFFSRPALELAQQAAQQGVAVAADTAPASAASTAAVASAAPRQVLSAAAAQLVLCCEVSGRLHALHAASGQPIWSTQLPGHVFAPLSTQLPGCVLAATQGGQVCCVSCADGALLWQLDVGKGPMSAAPVVLGSSAAAAAGTTAHEQGLLLASSNKGVEAQQERFQQGVLSLYTQRRGRAAAGSTQFTGDSSGGGGGGEQQHWELQQAVELPGKCCGLFSYQ